MPLAFWIGLGAGYFAGCLLSYRGVRFAATRIAEDSPCRTQVRRAGIAAGAVAALPALFFATVIGGNLGGQVGATLGARATDNITLHQVAAGIGIGSGTLLVMTVITIATTVAGGVFMKVYLAR